jgi:sec-independent protein translocase protein TatB
VFGIDSGELFIIAIVALVVIGPKDLPRVMRAIGNFVGKARGMAGHFRSGVDNMIRESELQDMEKAWKANNERIMREAPPPLDSDWGKAEPGDDQATLALPAPAAAADPSRPRPPPARPRRPRGKTSSERADPVAPPADESA